MAPYQQTKNMNESAAQPSSDCSPTSIERRWDKHIETLIGYKGDAFLQGPLIVPSMPWIPDLRPRPRPFRQRTRLHDAYDHCCQKDWPYRRAGGDVLCLCGLT